MALDPKVLFAQAMQGAIAGAIAGSRRSLDDATLQGVAQGAAIGALGGVLGGQVQSRANPSVGGLSAGALGGGALAGYLASRGPRGESRPDVHLRIDKGDNRPERSKLASEMRQMMAAKRRANLDAGAKRQARIDTTKNASNLAHAAELAGLGILAAPSVAEMRGRKVSDKTKHRAELAGLGVLAAPSAIHLGGRAVSKIKGIGRAIMNKRAFVGADDLLGGAIGYGMGREQKARGERHSFGVPQAAGMIFIPGGIGYQIGRAVGHGSKEPVTKKKKKHKKTAEHINGDPDTVDGIRADIASTPLGERALADSDGANQHPRVARAFLRRLAMRLVPRPQQLH